MWIAGVAAQEAGMLDGNQFISVTEATTTATAAMATASPARFPRRSARRTPRRQQPNAAPP